MADFKNQFSWSFSRHKTFQECPRLYYYTYYGYWNGWDRDAPEKARLLYRLKKMQNIPMWLGDLTHRMIERILNDMRNRELNQLERYQQQVRKWMNQEWTQSVEGKWRWKPKWNLNLFEHYYGIEISKEERLQARDKVFNCLKTFMESPTMDQLYHLPPEGWRSVEELESCQVGGEKVYIKIDCATQEEGNLVIYDWKTGKPTEDTLAQMYGYALYAHQVLHVPLDQQRLRAFYLDGNHLEEEIPTPENLVETKERILQSMESMIEKLESGSKDNVAQEENFPMTDQKGRCKRCFFREACYNTKEWPAPETERA